MIRALKPGRAIFLVLSISIVLLGVVISAQGDVDPTRVTVYQMAGSSDYHLANCPLAASHSITPITLADARRLRLTPCLLCHPDKATPEQLAASVAFDQKRTADEKAALHQQAMASHSAIATVVESDANTSYAVTYALAQLLGAYPADIVVSHTATSALVVITLGAPQGLSTAARINAGDLRATLTATAPEDTVKAWSAAMRQIATAAHEWIVANRVAIIESALAQQAVSKRAADWAASAPTGPTTPPHFTGYRVTGSSTSTASLTFGPGGSGTEQVADAHLPWIYPLTLAPGEFAYISAQNENPDGGCVKVEILVDAVTVKSSESCGAFTIASSSGRMSADPAGVR